MADSDKPRRPGKVIVLVIALWLVGGALQTLFGWLLADSGLVEAGTVPLLGLFLGWGLLCVICFYYRGQIETWLRR